MKIKNASDWIIALLVIGCSAVLLVALALAIEGSNLIQPGRTLRANFADITGLQVSSGVKYAGAQVGRVHRVRILSEEERAVLSDPGKAVELTMAIDPRAPELPANLVASIASNTLLSDKFVLLTGTFPGGGALPDNALIDGIAPTTFDELVRTANSALERFESLVEAEDLDFGELVEAFRSLAGEALEAVADGRELIGSARELVGQTGDLVGSGNALVEDGKSMLRGGTAMADDARKLLATTGGQVEQIARRLEAAASAAESMARRGDSLLHANQSEVTAAVADLRVAARNLRLTSAFSTVFARSIAERPHRIFWGARNPPALPDDSEILAAPPRVAPTP